MAAGHEVDCDHVRDQFDVRMLRCRGLQRLLHCIACSIGHVDNSPVAVTTLAGQVQRIAFGRERNAKVDQVLNCARRGFDDMLDDLDVVKAGSGNERVIDMGLETVALFEHRRNSALRPASRAFAKRALGDDRDFMRLSKIESGRKPCCAGSDD